MNTTQTPAIRQPRRRKLRAVLAAGLVLGLGAAVTLAAWNDSEYATGTFAAGTFNLEGSTDGTTYADHATGATAATLPFTVNPTNLSPGQVVYSPFAIRLAAGTTTGASVAVQAVTNTGTVTNLTYALVTTSSITCNAAAVTGATGAAILVPAGTLLSSVGTPAPFTLVKGATAGTAGAPVYLCFAVTAGAGLVQGQTGTATWQLLATSTS
ncbi:SipW-dependent-type signal peptide-containing protein [Nakamurella lactea]|uniref:SipW-dependent-type signal peptide-containing protein n=1 Tax=Nakamurella lactea TaxID=459515 RepID=UPI00040794BC|nr:SipW-dependent-type signal peptide-containing protein [Nakamurella lactea]